MILNLKRFGYLNTRKDRAEFTAVLNQVLNEPIFQSSMDTSGSGPYTEPPSEQEIKDLLRNKDKVDDESTAQLKKDAEDAEKAKKEEEKAKLEEQ